MTVNDWIIWLIAQLYTYHCLHDIYLSSLPLHPYHPPPVPAKLARLSLSLPPLSLSLPLSPNAKGGFWEGGEHRGGRRRTASAGSDPDEDEEEEQEDESPRRVIVVTETDVDKRVGLRSLLKSPKEPVDKENRDRGRNVSFFDDVTVYLFDQVCQGCLYRKALSTFSYLELPSSTFTLLNIVCFVTILYLKTFHARKPRPMNLVLDLLVHLPTEKSPPALMVLVSV